jgi:hypothetical protein
LPPLEDQAGSAAVLVRVAARARVQVAARARVPAPARARVPAVVRAPVPGARVWAAVEVAVPAVPAPGQAQAAALGRSDPDYSRWPPE